VCISPVVLSDVVDIQAGASHFCAIGLDGLVRCWGQNVVAQVGVEPDDLVAVRLNLEFGF
jgi:alpha-tubulin suppressor-like RCC1 family protein